MASQLITAFSLTPLHKKSVLSWKLIINELVRTTHLLEARLALKSGNVLGVSSNLCGTFVPASLEGGSEKLL